MKKTLCFLLSVLILFSTSFSFAEEEAAQESNEAASDASAFPELNEAGFLDEGEFLFEDEEKGLWRYCSSTLKVEIRRKSETKPALTWFEGEVWSRDGEMFHTVAKNPQYPLSYIQQDYPYKIARENKVVLAINNDYAQLRKKQKAYMGIIIRNGVVYSNRTKGKNAKGFPNLDCLALYPDGNMKVFWSNEKTADDFMNEGVTDVLSFGPWLIRDGEINAAGVKKYATTKQPRTAIGMVEPGHYYVLMAEGRIKRSKGTSVKWMAEKLLELGCTEGFNLDGGDTSTIVFMGHQLCKLDDKRKVSGRRTSDIIGIGTSDLVRLPGDPF